MLKCMKWRGSPSRMLLLFLLQIMGVLSALAQEPRLDVEVEHQPLSAVFQLIRKNTNYLVNYSEHEVNADIRVTVRLKQATVPEILTAALKGTGYEFIRNANAWIIRRKTGGVEKKERPARALTIVVTDTKSGAAIGGVSINLQGTGISTMTDADGRANLRFIDSPAVLVLTSVGYAILTIPVDAGATTLNVKMNRDMKSLGSVTVEARRKINNEAALLNDRKNAAVVSDGISAQQIERTASITTTQALQRVSGVTITDDKYVAIRGLGDRSVIAELNGVRLSSSDPDRSAIPLDLIPANLLDNIVVYKTETPDKPADAAAGIVELKTKSIPSGKTLSITAQTGWNSNIGIGGKVNSFYNSDMGTFGQKIGHHDLKVDFLGLSKQYPGGLSQIQQMVAGSINDPSTQKEVNRINNIMHNGFDPVLTTRYKNAPMNTIFSITYGNSLQVFHRHQLGLIAGASYYSRSTDVYGSTLNQYSIYQGLLTGSPYIDKNSPRIIPNYVTPNNINLGKYVGYHENTGVQTLNYGFLGGLSYRFNANHEISMQYMGSQGGETQATSLYGQYQYTRGLSGPVYSNIYSLKQTYRTLNTFNLQGEHKLWNGTYAPRLSYNGATSKSTQNDPDYRFVNLADYRPAGGGYISVPDQTAGSNGGGG